jgi:hypothetical protein
MDVHGYHVMIFNVKSSGVEPHAFEFSSLGIATQVACQR